MKTLAAIFALFSLSLPLAAQSLPATGAEITEYVRGYARITVEGTGLRTYGSGVQQTWRWTDGREAVRILIYQDSDEPPAPMLPAGTYTVTFAAKDDGCEYLKIAGWGAIEMYSADALQRSVYAKVAGVTETRMQTIKSCRLRDGTLEIWIEPASQ